MDATQVQAATGDPNPPGMGRLLSLDAFRGFVIVAMLVVNNPGHDAAMHRQLRHAAWGEPATFCDLVLPWFVFIMGVALPFARAAFQRRTPGSLSFLTKSARRAAMLVFLGILIDCSVAKRVVIGMNVLQLLGLSFLAAAAIRELPWPRVVPAVAGALLLAWWLFLRWTPIPEFGVGAFEAQRNAVVWLNALLRPYHLAGIGSVLPAASLALVGAWLGDRMRDAQASGKPASALPALALAAATLTAAGWIASYDLAMNKTVWTPAYVLWSAGTGAAILGLAYWAIDLKGWRGWSWPLVVFGGNAIFAYFVPIMVRLHTVQLWTMAGTDGAPITLWKAWLEQCTRWAGTMGGSWLFTASYVLFWFGVLVWMRRRGWIWKV